MIKAYVFDLDDTLYPEYDYVRSGFRKVAEEAEKKYGMSDVYEKLIGLFSEDKQRVYNRLFERENIAYTQNDIDGLIAVYRRHTPENLRFFDGVEDTLKTLRSRGYKLGIITDGRVEAQQAKIKALGVEKLVDSIIVTDSLGGEQFRKPNPLAFEKTAAALGVACEEMVYVGDNPAKDFAITRYLPVTTVRVWQGCDIYKDKEYLFGIKPTYEIGQIKELTEKL